MTAREARIVRVKGRFVIVECPYCGLEHEHANYTPGEREHRVAGCPLGTHINLTQRLDGYTFTVAQQRQHPPTTLESN